MVITVALVAGACASAAAEIPPLGEVTDLRALGPVVQPLRPDGDSLSPPKPLEPERAVVAAEVAERAVVAAEVVDITTTTTTTAPPTTTTTTTAPAPTTTVVETTTTTVPPPPPVLRRGDRGTEVRRLQARLLDLGFDPGPVDGMFGLATEQAVWALQKTWGVDVDGLVGPDVRTLLARGADIPVVSTGNEPDRLEVDLDRQLLHVFRAGRRVLTTHVSSGNGVQFCGVDKCEYAITPTGRFVVERRVEGWRDAPLGYLYNPLYFHLGFAIHGYTDVPPVPASHGCVRIPMHIAEYLPTVVPDGQPVYVFGREATPRPIPAEQRRQERADAIEAARERAERLEEEAELGAAQLAEDHARGTPPEPLAAAGLIESPATP
ncbi:MAG: L,D-transpeptidase family protein [Actinomycetota bacterium]|nr:L,D-transpeptidase family protein [Actinomycetota bacterium]